MHDAHYHYSKEINTLQNEYGISGICNVANEKEFELGSTKTFILFLWSTSLECKFRYT